MKFGQTLATRLTPEWRKQYISYSLLKDIILKSYAVASRIDGSEEYENFLAEFDEDFFGKCAEELTKVDIFFAEKKAEAKRKFKEFHDELGVLMETRKKSKIDSQHMLSKNKGKMMKLALSEYYLALILLRNFQTLNVTGFRKILKKHDKRLYTTSGAEFFNSVVQNADVFQNTEIEKLIEKTEAMFAENFSHGDRSRAMKILRVPPFESKQTNLGTFRFGFGFGVFACLLSFLSISASSSTLPSKEKECCLHLHSGSLIVIMLLFLIGLNICGWQKAGVNHKLIFEIDPRNHLTGFVIMEMASYFGIIWSLSYLTCYHKFPIKMPPNVFALTVVILMLAFWLNPLHIMLWSSRQWLIKEAARIVSAPFFTVTFADFWIADQFCSLATALVNFQFIPCSILTKNWAKTPDPFACIEGKNYYTSAILFCLPYWFRMLQCLRRYADTKKKFPFLVSGAKYSTAIFVSASAIALGSTRDLYKRQIDNPLFWMHILCRITNSSFSYAWDIFMDFGLFTKFSGENIFLRNEIIYAPCFYYFAIVEDLILRFLWVAAAIIAENDLMEYAYLSTLTGIGEVIRRYIWNLIRLENEHLNNCGQFRAVRDISIKVVAAEGERRLEEMMDADDGVSNRNSSMQSILYLDGEENA